MSVNTKEMLGTLHENLITSNLEQHFESTQIDSVFCNLKSIKLIIPPKIDMICIYVCVYLFIICLCPFLLSVKLKECIEPMKKPKTDLETETDRKTLSMMCFTHVMLQTDWIFKGFFKWGWGVPFLIC